MSISIKDYVGADKKVYFSFCRDSALWYRCEDGFEFPVPFDDLGTATFLAEDRSVFFMRWIRRHLLFIEAAKREQAGLENGK